MGHQLRLNVLYELKRYMPKQKEDFRHELHTARGRSTYRINFQIHKECPPSINTGRLDNRMWDWG